MNKIIFTCLLLFLCTTLGALLNDYAIDTCRYVLAIGSNSGGDTIEDLRYATTDAKAFTQIMIALGGVEKDNCSLLLNPGMREIKDSFINLNSTINQIINKKIRIELIIYYSGHSDKDGLLIKGENYFYSDLKLDINNLPADVRIVILDSCASGMFTREKGGKIKNPFMYDNAHVPEGHAYITSSSDKEYSHESDVIQASFFTYSLIIGMRGIADTNSDGKVTVREAYEYAFYETIYYTKTSAKGVQHPSFNISLRGTGNIILTDIREYTSTLNISEECEGRIYIQDIHGKFIVELRKERGKSIDMGIEPGIYTLYLDDGKEIASREIIIEEYCSIEISLVDFKKEKSMLFPGKGNENEKEDTLKLPDPDTNIDESIIIHKDNPDRLNLRFGYSFLTLRIDLLEYIHIINFSLLTAFFDIGIELTFNNAHIKYSYETLSGFEQTDLSESYFYSSYGLHVFYYFYNIYSTGLNFYSGLMIQYPPGIHVVCGVNKILFRKIFFGIENRVIFYQRESGSVIFNPYGNADRETDEIIDFIYRIGISLGVRL